MNLLKKTQSNLSKLLKSPFKKDNSLSFLNATQFTVVLLDNIFKLVIAFFLIDKIGKDKASQILSLVGAVYVIPFLLFSSLGGILADRYSKQRITLFIKIFEVLIVIFSFFAFAQDSILGAYSVLFLLSLQSALFGPSKYGIISDLVAKDSVAKGNGLITSFTYLAIISGTFLGSFLTEITQHGYLVIASIGLLISLVGTLSAFKIRYTPPSGSKKKINPLFLSEIVQTLRYTLTRPHLTLAIVGSSFFLFIGAFTQLNIIPYAIQEMKLSEVAGGYLFLSTAMGIAIGSIIAGKICKKYINLSIPLIGSFLLGILLMALKFTPISISVTIISLVVLGISGGMFIVPFDTFIQISASDEKRGQVIGAANFFGFVGVLIASFSLFIFSEILHLNASSGFLLVGIGTLIFSVFIFLKLTDYFLKHLSKKIINAYTEVVYEKKELGLGENTVLITTASSFKDLCLLSHHCRQITYLVSKGKVKLPFALQKILGCLIEVDSSISVLKRVELAKALSKPYAPCCIVVDDNFALYGLEKKSFVKSLFGFNNVELIYSDVYRASSDKALIAFSKIQ